MNAAKHWRLQRITAFVLLFLLTWIVYECVALYSTSGLYSSAIKQWLSDPSVGIIFWISMSISLYHGRLGLQVIVEDYVVCTTKQKIILASSDSVVLLCWILLSFSIISNLSIV